ncbi:hypothetical protein CC1G_15735 [Coprinopsis cinerea okayama7|uniref:Uncharacterized protein n=1 Tax=Coprinopsis cinerea (strain Okayama-7 / 130 / ATCC MYA-4618 / FGSC 9003) TaxID=240176 RepID=D6RQ94_COPC7|nr:hypothetical protein CC1G_15735 [Coprinopsis cinerea okayama7\|eukprot:XP_002910306.1 hypothetical protein CC1G_15735 [Coprinopsis cinerea okayama7\
MFPSRGLTEPSAVGSGDEEVNANNVNLALLPKLRRLGVQCYAAEDPGSVDPEEENFLDPLPSLITILNTIPRSNTIEDFHLTMDYGVEDTTRLDVDSWADVDEFLTNKARLPHLKSVRIEVNNFFDYFVDEIADEVRRSIPKLEASGMLTLRAQTSMWIDDLVGG